jgi:hypothetical protein
MNRKPSSQETAQLTRLTGFSEEELEIPVIDRFSGMPKIRRSSKTEISTLSYGGEQFSLSAHCAGGGHGAVETMDMGAMAMGGGGGVMGEMDFNSSYAVGTELEVLYHDAQESGWFAARVTHRNKTGLRVLYALDGYSELIVWVDVEVRFAHLPPPHLVTKPY